MFLGKNDRRYGKFRLDFDLLCNQRSDAIDVLQHCMVFRAEAYYASEFILYEAWCPLFREVPAGEIMPTYVFEVNTNTGELTANEI